LIKGTFRGFGGGGGGGGGIQTPGIPAFRERPGEGGPVGQGGGGGGFGGSPIGKIAQGLGGFRALRDILPRGGGGFGGGQTLVDPGDYLVTLTVAGKTFKQKVRVAKVKGNGGLPTGELEP